MIENRPRRLFRNRQWSILWVLALAVGAGAAGIVLSSSYADTRERLESETESIAKTVSQRLSAAEAVLTSLAGLYQASDKPEGSGLAAAARALMADYPYISSIAYASRISEATRSNFVHAMRQRGFPYFELFSLTGAGLPGENDQNMVVSSIEPLKPSSAQYLGADLFTDPGLSPALERAIERGIITVAPAVVFGEPDGSLLVKATFFGHQEPTNPDERRRQTSGAFLLLMHADRLLDDLTGTLSSGRVELLGTSETGWSRQQSGAHTGRTNTTPPALPLSRSLTAATPLRLGDTRLTLLVSTAATLSRGQLAQAALIGLLASILTVVIPIALANRHLVEQQQKIARETLFKEREQAAVTLQSIGDAVITIDNAFEVRYMNPVAESLTGWSNARATGRKLDEILELLDEKTGAALDYPNDNYLHCLKNDQGRLQLMRSSGDTVAVNHTLSRMLDADGRVMGAVLVIRDVSRERRLTRELAYRASHDPLTHLPNRKLFQERLRQALEEAAVQGQQVAVLFFDLDQFKLVNDTLGHAAGDELLKKVAVALRRCLRDEDLLARLGGDEFAAILCKLPSREIAEAAARRALDQLCGAFDLFGSEVFLTTSIGLAMFPQDATDLPSLLKSADAACYHAKARGRNNYQVFNISLNKAAEARMRLERQLRQALQREEFALHYQPQLDLESGLITGVEALLRWVNPELGDVSPGEFISVAEETGLIVPIGRWVVKEACRQAGVWLQEGLEPIQVSVNLSPRQFRDHGLPGLIGDLMNAAGLQPQSLRLEITESAIMDNVEESLTTLHAIHAMGIGLSIDDFGTGYSSLSALKQFPLDAVKIDCSFVRNLSHDPEDLEIVTAIVAMAHSLGLKVVAEGVENDQQLQLLHERGCDQIQGYYVSRPLPAAQLRRLLASDFRHGPAVGDTRMRKRVEVLRHFRKT